MGRQKEQPERDQDRQMRAAGLEDGGAPSPGEQGPQEAARGREVSSPPGAAGVTLHHQHRHVRTSKPQSWKMTDLCWCMSPRL